MNMSDVIPTFGTVVFNEKGEVLLVKHLEQAGHVAGVYGLPAGRARPGETGIQAAQRELKEETGLIVEQKDMLSLPRVETAAIKRSDGSTKQMSLQCFLATRTSGRIAETEETAPEWVSIEMFGTVHLLPSVHAFVADAVVAREN